MCDLRSFTEMANRLQRSELIEVLNRSFEVIEAPIETNDGEILKFIGDGLLAIFRAESGMDDACRRAFAAAGEATASLAKMREEAEHWAWPDIEFAMGLHVGEVAYGNVGGRHRLDFTVLGAAVNYASRLQGLAKTLDTQIVSSHDFAEYLPGQLIELGSHALRGIGDAEQIYAPAV
jgi:adenylate cyclase